MALRLCNIRRDTIANRTLDQLMHRRQCSSYLMLVGSAMKEVARATALTPTGMGHG